MSLTSIYTKRPQTFSEEWRDATKESPFARQNSLTISIIFRMCSLQDLGRLAVVCKSIRFFSEANDIWQGRYLERWSISWKWVGKQPNSWKRQMQKMFQLTAGNISGYGWSEVLWEQGLNNEAILEAKKKQATSPKNQASLSSKEMEVGIALSTDLIEASAVREENKPREVIEFVFVEMLNLINRKEYEKLFSLYIKNREGFIRFSTLKGWWMCEVLIRLYKRRKIDHLVSKEQQIHLPKEPKDAPANYFFSYFLGCNRFWLAQGDMLFTLPTLNCLRQLFDRTVDEEGIVRRETRKEMIYQMELEFDQLYLAQSSMGLRDLDNFAIDRMVVYMRAGFPNLAKQLLSLIVPKARDPIRRNELLGEAFLICKMRGKGYRHSAKKAFEKAHELLPETHHKARDYFERKILVAVCCIALEDEDSSDDLIVKRLESFNTSYNIHFKQIMDQLSIEEIKHLLKVIIKYAVALLYPNCLRYLQNMQISQIQASVSEKMDLCVLQIELHLLQNDFDRAALRWLDLYYLEKKIKQNEHKELYVDPAEWMYKLVDQNEGMAQELVNLAPKNPYCRLALAYDYYLEDDFAAAFEEVKQVASVVDRDDLYWLRALSESNFEAFLIYSYTYTDEGSLEEYFFDSIDDWPLSEGGAIYHNLAVRLYFEGFFDAALKNLEFFSKGSSVIETHILKFLLAERNDDEEMMQVAFEKVLELSNRQLLVNDREFLQDELFIY